MSRFLAGRIFQGLVIIFLVANLTFVLMRVAPGDPFARMTDASSASPEFISQARQNLGLDRPLHEQYALFLTNLARGDLGDSFSEHRPVWHAIRERIPATIVLALAALLIDFTLGISLGAYQGAKGGSHSDDALSVMTLVLYSVPVFWLGIVLVLLFSRNVGLIELFPVTGTKTIVMHEQLGLVGKLVDRLWHLFLPALTLGLVGAAGTARFQRAAMMDVVRQDYVRTARARGLSESKVILRHALRNALIPAITLFGLSFPVLLSGAVLVESVFSWPGLGRLLVDSIRERDYNVVTGAAIVGATMVVFGNILADLLYRVVDPRLRHSG